MSEKKTIGEIIYADIEGNAYLNEIYEAILCNYSLQLFQLGNRKSNNTFDLMDALRFADILSKSDHPERSDAHKMWAQEFIDPVKPALSEQSARKTVCWLCVLKYR